MNDQHKLEFLKALRMHGETLKKMADGGDTALGGPTVSTQGGSTKAGGLFGGLSDLLGTQNNFSASGIPLQAGTNLAQLQGAYTGAQQGLGQQQNFLNALQAQNGVQNQSDVYNSMNGVANGTGPNPAQTMLNQQTGQNVANQAALMAGQRGASQNVGLMARQAAEQGAQTQQNAVGQAAALQSQQQLNALNSQANISQNQVGNQAAAVNGLNSAQQNEQQILQGANNAYNQGNVNMQSNINNANAGVSMGNQRASSGILGGVLNGVAGAVGSLFAEGGEVQKFQDGGEAGGKAPVPTNADSPSAPSTMSQVKKGAENSGGFPSWETLKNNVKNAWDGPTNTQPATTNYAAGGFAQPFSVQAPRVATGPVNMSGPQSNTAQYLQGQQSGGNSIAQTPNFDSGDGGGGGNSALGDLAGKALSSIFGGSSKPAGSTEDSTSAFMHSPEGQDGALGNAPWLNEGGSVGSKLKAGGKVPGKPKVGGTVNTQKNDTVPALLSAGEIVLPRSVTKSADPVSAAAKFVEAILKKQKQTAKRAA